jgi:8-oxo-dGTP pyrophosphatase MutT (NUDIX family)
VDDRALVELRCSAIVFRGDAVLLLGRRRNGTRDWVLPGGHPRPREGTATCAYREVLEETGLDVQIGRVAFVLETTDPAGDRRLIEIVFLATERDAHAEPKAREPGLWPQFVPVDDTPQLDLRPPIAGYLRGLHRTRLRATAPYLGNLWREPADDTLDRRRGDRGG